MKQSSCVIKLADFIDDSGQAAPDGKYAVGNVEGRTVRHALAELVDSKPGQSIFEISLAGIKFTDASFPRESVISSAKLHRAEKAFFLTGFENNDLIDNWDYAAKAKSQPMLLWAENGYRVLGPEISSGTKEILDYINEEGTVTSAKVASKFGITSQNASGKLRKMLADGLIMGKKDSAQTGGPEFIFTAIK